MSKKKGPVVVLNLPDSTVVIGEVLDQVPGTFVLKRPISMRQHPLIDGLTLKKYNRFTTSKKAPVYFNTTSLVSHYWADKTMSEFYWRVSKIYQQENLSFGIIPPAEGPQQGQPTGSNIIEAINEPESERPDFEDLRASTTRLKD